MTSKSQSIRRYRGTFEPENNGPIVTAEFVDAADHDREIEQLQAQLSQIYDLFSIGADARRPSILLVNIENARRRSDCLGAIERDFFTKIAQDEDGEEVYDCPLSWGAEPAEYTEQFRSALSALTLETGVNNGDG